jgi:outer membrane usher protein FimD/PapC
VDVVLTDLQGRFVRTILADAVANEGENVFTFNKGALAPGTYFLQVSLNKKIIRNEKLLVAQP